jgi:F-box/WD-40 domain protein 5
VRPWPQGCTIENPLQPPPIAQEIDIHVIDLVTLKQVQEHYGHWPSKKV